LNLPINRSFTWNTLAQVFYLAGAHAKAQGQGFRIPGVEATDLAKGLDKSVIFIQG